MGEAQMNSFLYDLGWGCIQDESVLAVASHRTARVEAELALSLVCD